MDRSAYATKIVEGLSSGRRPRGFAPLYVALLQELAKGMPVSPQTLADRVGQPLEHVAAVLGQAPNTEFDERGNIVGYGITLRPTPHVFEVDGQRLYTWCALDALMFPALIGKQARIHSRCAETGAPVSLTVDANCAREVVPHGAVVSLVVPRADIRHSFCCNVHFFASDVVAARWVSRHPGTEAVSMGAAFMLGQEVVRQLNHDAELSVV